MQPILNYKKYKPQEEGKAKVRDLVKEFKEQCQFQIAGRHFGPDEFEQSKLHKSTCMNLPTTRMKFFLLVLILTRVD